MGASWQAFYAHLCAASIIRAMPETEIPPASGGGIFIILYAARLRIKPFCAKIPVIKTVVEGASMSEARVLYCQSCGAMLNVEANRAYIFCQYCGAKNVIASEQMKTNIN